MDIKNYLQVLRDVSVVACLEHTHHNNTSDYPCEGLLGDCPDCLAIYRANNLIHELESKLDNPPDEDSAGDKLFDEEDLFGDCGRGCSG